MCVSNLGIIKKEGVEGGDESIFGDELKTQPLASSGAEFGCGFCQFVSKVWVGSQLENDSCRAGTLSC